jgi:hypothetical protein
LCFFFIFLVDSAPNSVVRIVVGVVCHPAFVDISDGALLRYHCEVHFGFSSPFYFSCHF